MRSDSSLRVSSKHSMDDQLENHWVGGHLVQGEQSLPRDCYPNENCLFLTVQNRAFLQVNG